MAVLTRFNIAFISLLLLVSKNTFSDTAISEIDTLAQESEEAKIRSRKCKTLRNLVVCNALKVGGDTSLLGDVAIKGAVAIASDTAIAGDLAVAGGEAIAGPIIIGATTPATIMSGAGVPVNGTTIPSTAVALYINSTAGSTSTALYLTINTGATWSAFANP